MYDYIHPPKLLPKQKTKLNDDERRRWVDNDEELYHFFITSGLSTRRFIRENRAQIDAVINRRLA